jgi:hypothetical protein
VDLLDASEAKLALPDGVGGHHRRWGDVVLVERRGNRIG